LFLFFCDRPGALLPTSALTDRVRLYSGRPMAWGFSLEVEAERMRERERERQRERARKRKTERESESVSILTDRWLEGFLDGLLNPEL